MRFSGTTGRDEAFAVLIPYLESAGDLAVRGAEAVVFPEKMVGIAPAGEQRGVQPAVVARRKGRRPGGRRLQQDSAPTASATSRTCSRRAGRGCWTTKSSGRSPASRPAMAAAWRRGCTGAGRDDGRRDLQGHGFSGDWPGVWPCRRRDSLSCRPGTLAGRTVALTDCPDAGRRGRRQHRPGGGQRAADGSDYLGRVIAESRSDAAPELMLLVELPLGPARRSTASTATGSRGSTSAISAGLLLLAAWRRHSVTVCTA